MPPATFSVTAEETSGDDEVLTSRMTSSLWSSADATRAAANRVAAAASRNPVSAVTTISIVVTITEAAIQLPLQSRRHRGVKDRGIVFREYSREWAGGVQWHSNASCADPVELVLDTGNAAVFNVAFTWDVSNSRWVGLGRFHQSTPNAPNCLVPWHFQAINDLAYSDDGRGESYRTLTVPKNVQCNNIGEPKWMRVGGKQLVYCYTNGACPSATFMNDVPSGKLRDTLLASFYRNYFFDFTTPEHTAGRAPAHPIWYEERPEPDQPTAKNFLFFEHGGQPYAITLVEPTHSIYALSLTTGFMYPAYSPNTSSSVLGLGFSSDIRTSLSAGPIKIDEHRFLVAGHVAKGGWADAYRLTFFYVFSAKPPFAIKCVTPVMSFGLSERARASKEYALEYNTHIELHGRHVYLSIGVDNCFTRLLKLPLGRILRHCSAPPLKPNRARLHLSKDRCGWEHW